MDFKRKGIILAGGKGTRLYPVTKAVSKQLLPLYDKPMIYYSLSTLMLAGIRDILIITTTFDNKRFQELLEDGSQFGINISYQIQENPGGIAEAFIIGKNFIGKSDVALILGDNLFHGSDLITSLKLVNKSKSGASIFAYPVGDPERYGIVEFDANKKVIGIEEKPKIPKSNFAITGLYFYDNSVVNKAENIKPSYRGELEITDINKQYLNENNLHVELMGRGMTWFDTGTFDSFHEASSLIRSLEKRQGLKIGCPEEIAWRLGWIDKIQLENLAQPLMKSGYGEYLISIINEKKLKILK